MRLIIRTVTEKGQTTTTRSYFVTSRPAARLDPTQILQLRRRQWGIEAICHQRLDVSLHEDRSRVRSLSGVAVLGVLSRISLALFAAEARRPQLRNFTSWSAATVPLHVTLIRPVGTVAPTEGCWALASTHAELPARPAVQRYGLRPDIEERHRQIRCFYDLTGFRSRSFDAITAQVGFVLLAYTLRQWQLWRLEQSAWAGLSPQSLEQKVAIRQHWIVIYHQRAYAQLPLVSFARELLALAPEARAKALVKVQQLEESLLAPVLPLRPRPP